MKNEKSKFSKSGPCLDKKCSWCCYASRINEKSEKTIDEQHKEFTKTKFFKIKK